MSDLEIVLIVLLIAALVAAAWFFLAHRFHIRDTAEKLADAVKDAKQ